MEENILIDEENDFDDCHITKMANKSIEMSISLSEHCSKFTGLNIHSSYNDSAISTLNKHCNEQRELILNEIVETEKRYCECLQTINQHYAANIQISQIITKDYYEIIFPPSLSNLHIVHHSFFENLRSSKHLDNSVVDIFLEFISSENIELFNLYKNYVNNFSQSLLTIRQLSTNNFTFDLLLKKLQLDERSSRLDLPALLLNPVQRVPRYVLLLKQLSKHSTASDDNKLKFLLNKLTLFLEELNSSMKNSLEMFSLVSAPQIPKNNLTSVSFRDKIKPFFTGESNGFSKNSNFKTSTPILRNIKSSFFDADLNPSSLVARETSIIRKQPITLYRNKCMKPSSEIKFHKKTKRNADFGDELKFVELKSRLDFDEDCCENDSIIDESIDENKLPDFKMPTPMKKIGFKLLPDFGNRIKQKLKRIGSVNIKEIRSKRSPVKAALSQSFRKKFLQSTNL